MKIFNSFVVFMLLTVASVTFAQDSPKITIASDSSSGTYNKILAEIIDICNGPTLDIKTEPCEKPGACGGAVGNLDALFNNRVQAAFLHSDVFQFNSLSDPAYSKLKAMAWLFPEQVHVIIKRQHGFTRVVKPASMFSKEVREPIVFKSLSEIDGLPVGAAGGGWITLRVLKGANGKFVAKEYPSGGDVLKALDSGEIAAGIYVGAAPLPNVEKLDKTVYTIIPVGSAIADGLKTQYRESRINYPGLTSGPIATLAPVAIIMTRQFSTPAKVAAQKAFKKCLTDKLGAFHDEKSRFWQDVESIDNGLAGVPTLTFTK